MEDKPVEEANLHFLVYLHSCILKQFWCIAARRLKGMQSSMQQIDETIANDPGSLNTFGSYIKLAHLALIIDTYLLEEPFVSRKPNQ